MKNYVQPGKTVPIVAGTSTAAGEIEVVGAGIFGVATTDIASGGSGEIVTEGVFDLAKVSGASTSLAAGAVVYWNNSGKTVTTSSTSNTKVGAVLAPAANADTTVRVKIPAMV